MLQKNLPPLPLISLMLLAFSLPFELDKVLWRVGPLTVTNVELLLALTLLATAVTLLYTRARPRLPDRYWLWLLPFGAALLLAALFAPAHQANAFKAALRLMSGVLLALAVLQIVRQRRDGYLVAAALLAGGLIAAGIGMWESYRYQELGWLALFRAKVTVAGQYIRLTGPFDYANQAAMFIEASLPFLLALAWVVAYGKVTGRRRWLLLLFLALLTLFYVQASVLTFSRASFATILLVSLLLVGWLCWRQPIAWRRMSAWWLALALITGLLATANFVGSSGFRLRLQSGNEDQWYLAELETPPTLTLAANESVKVAVTAVNTGKLIWQSENNPPIVLGARWINAETGREHGQPRWPFPGTVMPGQQAQLDIWLRAPSQPGTYALYWDVVQEHVTWFGNKSGRFATTTVAVTPAKPGTAVTPTETTRQGWGYSLPIPNRRVLWTVGWQMWQERPWLGVGFDNYRLLYGARLGDPRLNNTIHTNNWYLEMLVSLGIVGALPFLLWLFWLALDLFRQTGRPDATMWRLAVAAGLLAYLIHGFLDFFLLFNATGLLFWLLVGLWAAEKKRYADWN
ncbi:MAG: O-antigen ligase family protein [Anaerolineae bacterium]|nr:O-antigen ligase family protein [Anaerolineae bacterium]